MTRATTRLPTLRHLTKRFWSIDPRFRLPDVVVFALVMVSSVVITKVTQPEPAHLMVIIATSVLIVMWQIAPWLPHITRHATDRLGWLTADHICRPRITCHPSERTNLANEKERRRYNHDLRRQLKTLPDTWDICYGRIHADAVATGPAGVVTLYHANLDGLSLRHTGGELRDSLRSRYRAFTARRGMVGYAKVTTNRLVLDTTHDLASDYTDPCGVDAGDHLPELPATNARELSAYLGLSSHYHITPIILAHGAHMDRPWGVVDLRYAGEHWIGWAILCHPDHLTELLDLLPTQLSTRRDVNAAHTAVDLLTRRIVAT